MSALKSVLLAIEHATLRRDELAKYSDVRGIRIEDDVLCTDGAPEVLTARLPKNAAEIEAIMQS